MNKQLYKHLEENGINKDLVSKFEAYSAKNANKQIYLITSPLGEKYNYSYEDKALVILIPKHKIIFINLVKASSQDFEDFYNDFIEDLNSISDKYDYKDYIGRPREWKTQNTVRVNFDDFQSIDDLLEESFIEDSRLQRVSDLIISLLIGSINDIAKIGVDAPGTLLQKVKKNIILFDGDQTRFIYQDFTNKLVTIQGLSGTGKTELLLNKLKDLYLKDEESRIFFTCHSITLANTLKERIPSFFNFMKVEKQIEWNKRLWVNRAWGSSKDKNSGIYSYICNFYNIPFLRYSPVTDYNKIFSLALEYVNNINEDAFDYAFDYVLIDERQDFPEVFFKLCEKITKEKVFIAGDIFQDIFETLDKDVLNVDLVLNKCYRTDPRTLMFAHSAGLGLFESKKINWFKDEEWNAFGYQISRFADREIHFTREPIRRFDDIDNDTFESMRIVKSTRVTTVVEIIKEIRQTDPEVKPDDIAIILLDEHKQIYDYIDSLSLAIGKEFGVKVNRAHENKIKIPNTIYLSNPNHAKGLEFPFVICITGAIKNTYKFRNILYTMLTRSFLKSYLLLNEGQDIQNLEDGLKVINENHFIRSVEPTEEEKAEIRTNLVTFLEKPQKSYKEFLDDIFNSLEIDVERRQRIEEALVNAKVQPFDEEMTRKFIQINLDFY